MQPLVGAFTQEIVERFALGHRKQRQPALAEFDRQIAAQRDLIGVRQRLRNVGEQLDHLGLRLEILIRTEGARPPLVGEHLSLGDADARLVRGEFISLEELHRMGGRHRQFEIRSQLQRLLHAVLNRRRGRKLRQALHFEVITLRQQFRPFARVFLRLLRISGNERHTDVAMMRAGQCDQSFAGRRSKPFAFNFGAPAVLVDAIGLRHQFAQIAVAGARLAQQ